MILLMKKVEKVESKIDFDGVMKEVKAWGAAFHKEGKLEVLNAISNEVFGLGKKNV